MKKISIGLMAFLIAMSGVTSMPHLSVYAEETVQESAVISEDTGFTKYNLTEEELLKIASLCQAEQGSALGAAAEASMAANRYELYGANYSSLYDYIRYCRWFAYAASHMDRMNARSDVVEAVRTVLIDGKRTLPAYVDDHDCFSDIIRSENNGNKFTVSDRTQYKRHQTQIYNCYSGNYTFFSFPDVKSDPFGYSNPKLKETLGGYYYDLSTGQRINEGDEGISMDDNSVKKTIPDGDYLIAGLMDENTYLQSETDKGSANIQMQPIQKNAHTSSAVWTVEYQNNGFYRIKKRGTKLFLGIANDSVYRNANVQLSEERKTLAQEWAIIPSGSGYKLQSRCSSFYLNVEGTPLMQPDENAEVQEIPVDVNVFSADDSGSQIFGMIPVNSVETVSAGKYGLQYNQEKWLSFKETAAEMSESGNLNLRIIPQGNGWYQIKDEKSGLSLTASDTNQLTLSEFSGTNEQLWMFRHAEGHFAIISASNGYCLSQDLKLIPYGTSAEKWDVNTGMVSKLKLTVPLKTTYLQGESLNLNGMKVTAVFSDKTKKDVTSQVIVKGDTSKAGKTKIAVSYGGKTETFSIKVKAKQD